MDDNLLSLADNIPYMLSELLRQVVHLSGLVFVLIAQFLPKEQSIAMFLSIGIIFLLYSEYVTRKKGKSFLRRFILFFERKHAERLFQGAIWFYLGAAVAYVIFPLQIASAAVAILAVGDSASTIIGVCFGRHKIRTNKTIEGSLAFLIFSFIAAFFFVPKLPAFAGSLAGALVELYMPANRFDKKIKKGLLDDNLWIPIISGLVMWILVVVF